MTVLAWGRPLTWWVFWVLVSPSLVFLRRWISLFLICALMEVMLALLQGHQMRLLRGLSWVCPARAMYVWLELIIK